MFSAALLLASALAASAAPIPKSFYIIGTFRSDDLSAGSLTGVLDVRGEDSGSKVRRVHLRSGAGYCPAAPLIVRLKESKSSRRTMRDLIGDAPICSIGGRELRREYRRPRLVDLMEHPANFIVVADCGKAHFG